MVYFFSSPIKIVEFDSGMLCLHHARKQNDRTRTAIKRDMIAKFHVMYTFSLRNDVRNSCDIKMLLCFTTNNLDSPK